MTSRACQRIAIPILLGAALALGGACPGTGDPGGGAGDDDASPLDDDDSSPVDEHPLGPCAGIESAGEVAPGFHATVDCGNGWDPVVVACTEFEQGSDCSAFTTPFGEHSRYQVVATWVLAGADFGTFSADLLDPAVGTWDYPLGGETSGFAVYISAHESECTGGIGDTQRTLDGCISVFLTEGSRLVGSFAGSFESNDALGTVGEMAGSFDVSFE